MPGVGLSALHVSMESPILGLLYKAYILCTPRKCIVRDLTLVVSMTDVMDYILYAVECYISYTYS